MPAAEQFGDLHRVERRAFAEVVRHAPEVQTVFDRRVFANSADEGREVADAFDGGDVAAVLALVVEHDAGSFAQDALRILGRQLILRSEEHTSELQSLMRISYAVFCLKKKNIRKQGIT